MSEKLNKSGNRRGMNVTGRALLERGRLARISREELMKISRKGGETTAANARADPVKKAAMMEQLKRARAAIDEETMRKHNSKAARALAERLGKRGNTEKMHFARAVKHFRAKGYLVEVSKEEKDDDPTTERQQ